MVRLSFFNANGSTYRNGAIMAVREKKLCLLRSSKHPPPYNSARITHIVVGGGQLFHLVQKEETLQYVSPGGQVSYSF